MPLAYLRPDLERDDKANNLLAQHKVTVFDSPDHGVHVLKCYSSESDTRDTKVIIYTVQFNRANYALSSCNCPDWMYREGACKHMRAALLYYNAQPNRTSPDIVLPPTEGVAVRLTKFDPSVVNTILGAMDANETDFSYVAFGEADAVNLRHSVRGPQQFRNDILLFKCYSSRSNLRSSNPKLYDVVFRWTENGVLGACTCNRSTGRRNGKCEHVRASALHAQAIPGALVGRFEEWADRED